MLERCVHACSLTNQPATGELITKGGVRMVDRTEELKSRVEAKRAELETQLKQQKADAQGAMNDQVEVLERKLGDLNEMLREGWERVSDKTVQRLNDWLKS
jgi:hypothetical protein